MTYLEGGGDPGSIIFGSKKRTGLSRIGLFAVLVLAIWALFRLVVPSSGNGMAGLIAPLIASLTLAVHFGVLLFGRRSEYIELDAAGLRGNFNGLDAEQPLSWDRVQHVQMDGRAVVVRYAPRDLSSNDPRDRRSQLRLAVAKTPPQEIEAAIRMFWKQ